MCGSLNSALVFGFIFCCFPSWVQIFSNYHHSDCASNIRVLSENPVEWIKHQYISALTNHSQICLFCHYVLFSTDFSLSQRKPETQKSHQLSAGTTSTHSLRAYSLSIHGVHHLDVNLQLIQREQHPLSTIRTPSQINQVYLWRGGQMLFKCMTIPLTPI